MGWMEFSTRVFGGVVAIVLFLVGKEIWERWTEKHGK